MSKISEAIGDYLAWAQESGGVAKIIAYLLPVAAIVAIAAAGFALATGGGSSDSSSGGNNPLLGGVQPTKAPAVALTPVAPGQSTPARSNPSSAPGTTPPAGLGLPSPTPSGPPPPTPVPPTPTPAPVQTYKVVSGDNPTTIARKLNVPTDQQTQSIADLLKLNNTTAQALNVGADLKLPPNTPGSAPAPAPGGAPAPTATRPAGAAPAATPGR